MEWQAILALVLVIPLILVPVAFIWYLNVGGLYVAIKEGRLRAFEPVLRRMRIGLAVIVPTGVYAYLVWFFFGHFGWPVALALALVLPIVFFVPVMVWAAVASGLFQVALETMRQRATATRRRSVRMAEEPVTRNQ